MQNNKLTEMDDDAIIVKQEEHKYSSLKKGEKKE